MHTFVYQYYTHFASIVDNLDKMQNGFSMQNLFK